MKTAAIRRVALYLPVILWLLAPAAGWAQGSRDLKIRKIDHDSQRTPQYNTSGNYGHERQLDWLRLSCAYETDPDWMDDLEFTYYVLLKSRDNRQPYNLLKGTITYINVPKGRHYSFMYVHPAVIERYGSFEGMAVMVRQSGRPLAVEATSNQYQRWIESLTPMEGTVQRPSRTPFAMVLFDNVEMVKPAGQ